MYCCSDSIPSKYSPVDTNEGNSGIARTSKSDMFPGLRRSQPQEGIASDKIPIKFSPTGGNALKEYTATSEPSHILAVTVPMDASPGQILHVKPPNSEEQMIQVTIPPGLSPGSTFHVSYAHKYHQYEGSISKPKMSSMNASQIAEPSSSTPTESIPTTSPYSSTVHGAASIEVRDYNLSQNPNLDHAIIKEDLSTKSGHSVNSNDYHPTLILVKVPPGVSPGSTIRVQVPSTSENRQIDAVVPPGVSEFYVTYNPNDAQKNADNEKLVLVKVPEGVTPGSIIHVEVNGSDQKIEAVVPHEVTEFYVAYR